MPPDSAPPDSSMPDAGVDAPPDAGPPTLVALSVSGDRARRRVRVPLTLVPAFSPDVHDYYVRCAAGDERRSPSR